MKTIIFNLSLVICIMFTLSSCEVIGGIFKAGVWVGIIAVVAVLGLVGLLISKAGKK